MTKYHRQRTFITWRKGDETQRKWWSCDENYNQIYNAILLTNKNGTKYGLQNKNSAKVSLHFRWPKRDDVMMKCNNIILSRYYYYFAVFLFPESQFRCCIRSLCTDAGDVSSSVPTHAALLRRCSCGGLTLTIMQDTEWSLAQRKGPMAASQCSVFPPVSPVSLNPRTVYNHMDAVIMCSDWDTDPPNILESDKVTFFALNYIITWSSSVNWMLSDSLARTEADFWGKVHRSLGLEGWFLFITNTRWVNKDWQEDGRFSMNLIVSQPCVCVCVCVFENKRRNT